jgi:Ni/Co efflux regulator RcnB
MRFMVARFALRLALVSSFALPLALPADAQTRLPRTSPAERKSNEINQRIRQEQRELRLEGRIQTETNQIRQNIDRQRQFSTRPPSFRNPNCPSGAIGC